jgi:hypothetical protein
MEITDEQIAEDKKLSHAVEVVDIHPSEGGKAIAEMLTVIGERALAAGMIVLSTTISTNTYLVHVWKDLKQSEVPRLVVTIICHWQNREMLESMQRQNALMGQPGPRRAH